MKGILLIATLVFLSNSVWCLPTPDEPTVIEIRKDEVLLPVVKVESKEPEVVKPEVIQVKVEPIEKIESIVLNKVPEIKETIVKSDVLPEVIKISVQSDEIVKEEKPSTTLLEVDSQGHENKSDRVARQFGFGGFGGFGGHNPYGHGFGRYGGFGGLSGFGRYRGFGGSPFGFGGFGRSPFGYGRYGGYDRFYG